MESDVGDEIAGSIFVQQKTVSPDKSRLMLDVSRSSSSNIFVTVGDENSSPAASSSSSALTPITVGDRLFGQNHLEDDNVQHVTLDCVVVGTPTSADSVPGVYLFLKIML